VEILEVEGRRKQVSGTIRGKVPLAQGTTVFMRAGNWFALLALLCAIAVVLHACGTAVLRKVRA
jgi:apolipoprotein N-acyltransferase